MTKALVMGGTRFFGIHLVESLLERGIEVTIATRGNTEDPFGDRVHRIKVDRSDLDSMKIAFTDTKWDIIFDQICYSAKDATEAAEVFKGKTDRYILTSTLSVYDLPENGQELMEKDFYPYNYPIEIKEGNEVSYQKGKRQAEAVIFQKSGFSAAAVRFPIVLGLNDYTNRLKFHINRVLNEEEIYFTNTDSSFGYISEEEAGKFLAWIGTSDFEGPFNACATGTYTLKELMELIEERTGKAFILAKKKNEENESPYNIPASYFMSNQKAADLGYKFTDLFDWLPGLISKLIEEETAKMKS
ncbi:NAD-dependent epimerase/dehydratase family protein [Neobacillus terrae]|uniref:NAD-dependent epimerase/dehydratase family protein n=1 Tax=Neobacillus terrae TaxID=3034837 RepID=UPI0014094BAF|nr:NAD-dependent epimerase/dehydratase family protein [Neobacillus terrae]NHM30818.1 NAD-dependent epimerase/dehydratase family protein [Neobacillus terrae]